MGTWGTGNFDSDEASECLENLISQLHTTIQDHMIHLDEPSFLMRRGEKQVIPLIDIIVTLSKHYDSSSSIDVSEVNALEKNYMEIFDRDIAIYTDSNFITERRKVILQTFDNLRKIAEE